MRGQRNGSGIEMTELRPQLFAALLHPSTISVHSALTQQGDEHFNPLGSRDRLATLDDGSIRSLVEGRQGFDYSHCRGSE
jgi:hypothetical protein